MKSKSLQRYMIQIDSPDETLDMGKITKLLEPAGVRLDLTYGPFNIKPESGRYIVRGTATERAKEKARKIPGVSFFGDGPKIGPTR